MAFGRRWMARSASTLLVLSSLCSGAFAADLLDQWTAAQAHLRTWSADCIQTRSLKTLAQPLVSTGKVWVAVPDRFRWELGQPAKTIALRMPSELMIIYPILKRAEKYSLANSQPGPWRDALALLEASFPRSRTNLEAQFRVISIAETNAVARLVLQPRSAAARKFVTELQIGFRTDDFTPLSTQLTFSDGSVMRNDFTHGSVNLALDPSLFEPNLGPDFKVVDPLHP